MHDMKELERVAEIIAARTVEFQPRLIARVRFESGTKMVVGEVAPNMIGIGVEFNELLPVYMAGMN